MSPLYASKELRSVEFRDSVLLRIVKFLVFSVLVVLVCCATLIAVKLDTNVEQEQEQAQEQIQTEEQGLCRSESAG